MHITKLQFKNLVSKIVSSLTTHLSDPAVINYNFYDNTSGVGVKMVRKTNRITVNDLAITVNDLAIKLNDLTIVVHDLTLEVRAGFAKMDAFITKQEEFNEWVKKEIMDIKNCPTIKRELPKSKE